MPPAARLALLAAAAAAAAGGAAALPAQDRTGPHYEMDYGPCLSTTIEGFDGHNVALKGRAIFLGDDAGVVFDTELLRVAAAWVNGFLVLRGTPFDGAHGPIPRASGDRVLETRQLPGWSSTGSFEDPRPIPYGPLPARVGRFKGHYLHGDQVVLSYRVGETDVLEKFDVVLAGGRRGIARTLAIGPVEDPLRLVVCEQPGTVGRTEEVGAPSTDAPSIEIGARNQRAILEYTEIARGDRSDRRRGRRRRNADGASEPRAEPRPVDKVTVVGASAAPDGAHFLVDADGRVLLALPISTAPAVLKLVVFTGPAADLDSIDGLVAAAGPPVNLQALCRGGPTRYPEVLKTEGTLGDAGANGANGANGAAYVVDTITVPADNPWKSRLRFGAFDFLDGHTAALSTWNGDVWTVSGIDRDLGALEWKRFATGLHDPLGLKVQDGLVHTLGRDQITRLHDLNGDGEADFYENFNNGVLITKSFHEFAFDLQCDAEGNFYFSKGGPVRPGGRGFDEIVPHHGAVLKVSKDGRQLEVFATGLRAPNGIGVSPDGVVTSGDNQGTWVPACRISWLRPGAMGFGGVMDTAHRDPKPETYDDPLCFLPMAVDNSSGGQTWVESDRWGPLQGELLHLSYGTCNLYLAMRQQEGDRIQGGVVRFPLSFASSLMRGRFNEADGQLYVCGFKGWQTRAAQDTAFQRVRYTGAPLRMPRDLRVTAEGIWLTFTDPLDRDTATDPDSYGVEHWNYRYSESYGSPEVSVSDPDKRVEEGQPNRDPLPVRAATLSRDGRTVFLAIDGLQRVMQMHLSYDLDSQDGELVEGDIYHTVNFLGTSGLGPRRPPR